MNPDSSDSSREGSVTDEWKRKPGESEESWRLRAKKMPLSVLFRKAREAAGGDEEVLHTVFGILTDIPYYLLPPGMRPLSDVINEKLGIDLRLKHGKASLDEPPEEE